MNGSIPIVITAFGTTTKALKTYDHVDALVRKRFPGHEIRWAYTSRMVKDRVKRSRNLAFPDPGEVLSALHDEGHIWSVVQSLHVLCGHEFDRLVEVAFEARGVEVSLDEQGLAGRDGIIEIFCRHIAQALDVIPVDWKVKR